LQCAESKAVLFLQHSISSVCFVCCSIAATSLPQALEKSKTKSRTVTSGTQQRPYPSVHARVTRHPDIFPRSGFTPRCSPGGCLSQPHPLFALEPAVPEKGQGYKKYAKSPLSLILSGLLDFLSVVFFFLSIYFLFPHSLADTEDTPSETLMCCGLRRGLQRRPECPK
jgi:hypothetical protein